MDGDAGGVHSVSGGGGPAGRAAVLLRLLVRAGLLGCQWLLGLDTEHRDTDDGVLRGGNGARGLGHGGNDAAGQLHHSRRCVQVNVSLSVELVSNLLALLLSLAAVLFDAEFVTGNVTDAVVSYHLVVEFVSKSGCWSVGHTVI